MSNDNALTDVTEVAAVDIGSNSIHIIVARQVNGALQPLIAEKQMVRLAAGLKKGKLDAAAVDRGLHALHSFEPILNGLPADRVRIIATHALRAAKNRDEFIAAAREILPYPVEVVSGDEEARLIYQGVAHTTPADGRRLIIDIGGGSTEFIIGEQFQPLQLSSLSMGSESYRRKFFKDGVITRERLAKATEAASVELAKMERRFCATGWQHALGTSGSIKVLLRFASLCQDDFNDQLTPATLSTLRDALVAAEHIDNLEGVDSHRQPQLPAAFAILDAAFGVLGIESLQLNEAALREGVLYELCDQLDERDIRTRTIDSLCARYTVDSNQSQRVQRTVAQLLPQLGLRSATHKEYARYLYWAAALHEIGLDISHRKLQEHGRYIITNADLPGFSHEQQQILATLVGMQRKRFYRHDLPKLTLLSRPALLQMVLVLRLAVLLNTRRLDRELPPITLSFASETTGLSFADDWLESHPLLAADLEREREYWRGCGLKLKLLR
ncbi:hypothetical protein OAM26_01640 [Porticoccaceae bacterium]|nr:hypothetical protein [Porticoccaceae bacterium]